MIIISLGFSFFGTNNTKYYTDEINQALKTNSPNVANEQISVKIKYLDTQGATNALRLEKYQTKKQYIDYNKDGTYSGRSEDSSTEENTDTSKETSKESDK